MYRLIVLVSKYHFICICESPVSTSVTSRSGEPSRLYNLISQRCLSNAEMRQIQWNSPFKKLLQPAIPRSLPKWEWPPFSRPSGAFKCFTEQKQARNERLCSGNQDVNRKCETGFWSPSSILGDNHRATLWPTVNKHYRERKAAKGFTHSLRTTR